MIVDVGDWSGRAQLIADAEADRTYLPGHWDTWVLGVITKRVRTQLGIAFESGDITLIDPAQPPAHKTGFRLCYSRRNRVDTWVPREVVHLD